MICDPLCRSGTVTFEIKHGHVFQEFMHCNQRVQVLGLQVELNHSARTLSMDDVLFAFSNVQKVIRSQSV